MEKVYDYVIVGAGSAGCVMANRLSENPQTRVCLLEAGPPDRDPRIHVPGLLGELLASGVADWNYSTTPQRFLNGRRIRWPRGKTLGGSSSINAMCYQRGALSDYDDWAEAGVQGWGGMDALHYFKKSERFSEGADQWHGGKGPLAVTRPEKVHPATQIFLTACGQAGHRQVTDFHAGNREGVGIFDATTKDGRRWSTAKAFLSKQVRARSNLTIITGATAKQIMLDGPRASGVIYRHNKEDLSIEASNEVILCGGAINSPQLLMLSGIGPADHLRDVGQGVAIDLPGVGENLQDHLDISIMMNTRPGTTIGYSAVGITHLAGSALKYAATRKGTLASNLAEGCGFVKSREDLSKPDIQLHFLPGMTDNHGSERFFGQHGLVLHACNLYPKSRGTIRLHSTNPFIQPDIDPNYLSREEDWDVMIEACKVAYRIMRQPAFDDIRQGMRVPLDRPHNNDSWRAIIRARADTIYHPVGTCKMGDPKDPMAVTSNAGRVYRTQGLRVVDASLMPTLIGGNTNAPTIMMAEKIADHMLKTA